VSDGYQLKSLVLAAGRGILLKGIIFRGCKRNEERQTSTQTDEGENSAEKSGLFALFCHWISRAPGTIRRLQSLLFRQYLMQKVDIRQLVTSTRSGLGILGIAARDEADEITGSMLVQLLRRSGHHAESYLSVQLPKWWTKLRRVELCLRFQPCRHLPRTGRSTLQALAIASLLIVVANQLSEPTTMLTDKQIQRVSEVLMSIATAW